MKYSLDTALLDTHPRRRSHLHGVSNDQMRDCLWNLSLSYCYFCMKYRIPFSSTLVNSSGESYLVWFSLYLAPLAFLQLSSFTLEYCIIPYYSIHNTYVCRFVTTGWAMEFWIMKLKWILDMNRILFEMKFSSVLWWWHAWHLLIGLSYRLSVYFSPFSEIG